MGALVRYAGVGVAATAVHYALLTAGVELGGWRPAWAAGIGAAVGAQVAYVGNRWLTFEHRGPWWSSWWRFQGTAAIGVVASSTLVALGTQAGVHYLLAQVAATILAMLLTFAINRRWTFA
jgi:putative flippase GtrA